MKPAVRPDFPPWPGNVTREVERNLAAEREWAAHEREIRRTGWICLLWGALASAPMWFFLGLEWPTIWAYLTLPWVGLGI